PDPFAAPPAGRRRAAAGPAAFAILLAGLGALWVWSQNGRPPAKPEMPARTSPSRPAGAGAVPARSAERHGSSSSVHTAPGPCPGLADEIEEAIGGGERDRLDSALRKALTCKIQREDYAAYRRAERGLQDFPEERWAQRIRTRLVSLRRPPSGTPAPPVPHLARPVTVDGIVRPGEWDGAAALPVPETATRVFLGDDGERLLVAADVPEEITPGGFDSLRLVLHPGLSSWQSEEYLFVYKDGTASTGCRISAVRWPGEPPPGGFAGPDRWKNFRLNECGLYGPPEAASRLEGHRAYELAIPWRDIGVEAGAAFALALEIETDPVTDLDPSTGKRRFRQRRYVGRLGMDGSPLWFTRGAGAGLRAAR
ncbi:MAG: hypothetical protein D6718_06215, partial [Acidobacteria bacterium]